MLKRTLCAAFAVAVLVAFSVPAFAGSHHKMRVRGTVESVDPAQKTFVVKDRDGKAIPFRVDDRSEFELEHRDKPDQDVPFTELKTGDRVKVKAFKAQRGFRFAACCFKHTGSTESMQEKFPEKSQRR